MFGLYLLKDWYGNLHLMSASKIHKQVMEQSQNSNYDWIASATDLISVCEKKNFPKHFEIDIKTAILNCFSQLINCDNDSTRGKKTDLNAVYYAYNSLYEIQDERVIEARAKFLTAFLLQITLSRYTDSVKGKTYHEYCIEWRNKQFDELFSKTDINFSSLKTKLEKEFQNSIAIATKTGIISKDDVKLQIINETDSHIELDNTNELQTDEEFNNTCNESLSEKPKKLVLTRKK